jgi:hypothetical protein
MKNFDRQSDNFASRTPPFPPRNASFFPWFYLVLLGFILPAACPGSWRRSRATAGLTSS